MWQPSAYAASPSPSSSQRPRGERGGGGTPKINDNDNNNVQKIDDESVQSAQLALDDELTRVRAFWDSQMTAYELNVEKARAATAARHAVERQALTHKLGSAPVKPRPSSDLLSMRRLQATLAKAGKHAEGNRVKRKADALETMELRRAGALRGGMLETAKDKLACKQQDEVRALEERIRDGHVKLERQRRSELEQVTLRHRAAMMRQQRRLSSGGGGGGGSVKSRGGHGVGDVHSKRRGGGGGGGGCSRPASGSGRRQLSFRS